MSVEFFTERSFPRVLRQMGHYNRGYGAYGDDFMSEVAQTVKNASPWDFLKGIFVDKPAAEAAARVQEAQLQAQAIEQQQMARQQTLRTVAIVGAGLVGLLVIVVAMKPASKKVAGYRRKKRRTR